MTALAISHFGTRSKIDTPRRFLLISLAKDFVHEPFSTLHLEGETLYFIVRRKIKFGRVEFNLERLMNSPLMNMSRNVILYNVVLRRSILVCGVVGCGPQMGVLRLESFGPSGHTPTACH